MRVYQFLDNAGIPYRRADHDAAQTMEACVEIEKVLGAPICKNLFLCNRQQTDFYLLLLDGDKVFKTKDLSKLLGVSRLSFAGAEQMQALLDITPGSVSVLGLMNDRDRRVRLVIDRPVAQAEQLCCHPCINTSTLKFRTADLFEKILPALGREATIVDLPDPEDA